MKINKIYKFIIVLIFAILSVCLFNTIISFAEENAGIATISTSQLVADGTYIIKSAINDKFVLDVSCSSQANGANVTLYQNNKTPNQQFKIKHLGNDYYQITMVHSGKSLDVTASGQTNETNVEQYSINNPISKNQRWKIQKNSDGTYSFISECNNLYLDVYTGSAKNGTNIQMYKGHGGNSQKFKLESLNSNSNASDKNNNEKKDTTAGSKTLNDGVYAIKYALNDKYAVNVSGASQKNEANVALYEYKDFNHQKFTVKYLNDGYYSIVALHSGKSLDVTANGQTNETNVEQYSVNNPASKNQKWKLQKNSDGTYSLISACNGLYLDVYASSAANGKNIQMYQGHGGISQKFKFVPATYTNPASVQGSQTIKDGVYSIATASNENYVLDVEGGSKSNNANIQIYEKQSAKRQRFNVKYLNDGTYQIMAEYSGKVLDAEYGGRESGKNVCQYALNTPSTTNQKWIIKDAGDGYYYIISKTAGLYLDLCSGAARNSNNIEVYTGHGETSQKFKFVQPLDVVNTINTSKYPGYKEKISALMDAHPGWNFELLYTELRFDQVTSGEASLHTRNLIPDNYSGEWVCSSCGTKRYDNGSWFCASEKATAYYMDPRNFLDEINVFQFQDVNEYINNVCTLQGIQSKVNGTFLQNYASAIDNACRNKNVNPYYIVARVLQEQGINGTQIGKGMSGGDGKLYYNPFNIGASGNGTGNIYSGALAKAKASGWDSMQKGLEGGIEFCKTNWLENYQNTLYQNKFDIDTRSGGGLYTHQYMQNLLAAYNEALTLRSMYVNTGKTDSNFTFIIPMYENMNSNVSPLPVNNQETGPKDFKVISTNQLNVREQPTTDSKIIGYLTLGQTVLSVERGIGSNWHRIITRGGLVGYVSGDYLQQINDQTNCNYRATIKTRDGIGCNVRMGPSTGFGILTSIPDNAVVTVIERNDYNFGDYNWYRVQLSNGQQGFIPSIYLV